MSNNTKRIWMAIGMIVNVGVMDYAVINVAVSYHLFGAFIISLPFVAMGFILSGSVLDRIDEFNGIPPHDGMHSDLNYK